MHIVSEFSELNHFSIYSFNLEASLLMWTAELSLLLKLFTYATASSVMHFHGEKLSLQTV